MKIVMKIPLTVLLAGALLISQAIHAQEFQSLDEIRQQAGNYIRNEIGSEVKADIRISALDSRLRLKKCTAPLAISTAHGQALSGKTTLAVKCSEQNWSLMVPVNIDVYLPVYISNRPISRGDIIKAGDFSQVTRKVSLLPGGYISDESQILGYKARRFLRQGMVIPPAALTQPLLVSRGESVTLVARSGGLVVRMQGEAMTDGARDQLIKVKNLSSQRIVEGVVSGQGIVNVKM